MKRLLFLTLLLTACATSPKPTVEAPKNPSEITPAMVIADPNAPPQARAIALRAMASEMLYSKEPKVKNPAKAYDLFLQAAELGDPVSMDQLGGYHTTGLAGKEKSCKLAIEWFEKSAAAGYELATNNLAYLLVSCEDKKLRDPKRAEDIMQFLFARNTNYLAVFDTYAAVLAELGNFKLATKAMDVVIDMAELVKGNQERLDEFKKTRELYAKNKRLESVNQAEPDVFRKTKK
jgi:TPR repeat protein